MRFSIRVPLLVFLFLALFSLPCLGEGAALDVTGQAVFSSPGREKRLYALTDGDLRTRWESTAGEGENALEITLPPSVLCGAVSLKWYGPACPWQLQAETADGWRTLAVSSTLYLSDLLLLPEPLDHFRVCPLDERDTLSLAEVRLLTPGTLPGDVQAWQPTVDRADLLLLACHPDDEVLWFGGALPTYAGELKMNVLVATLSPSSPWRRLELLDCLWTCGVRTYPVFGEMEDIKTQSLQGQYRYWNRDRLRALVTLWYRRYQPRVVLTHDIRGEYGHGGHRVCADLAIGALDWANDPERYIESYREFGRWNVPKLYLHLYGENPITLSWDRPLSAFGGKTGLEVAREGFLCHKSQQVGFAVRPDGPYPCTRFGLYRSLVGPDTRGDDFFEHLPVASLFEVEE